MPASPKAAVTAVVPSPFHHADAGELRCRICRLTLVMRRRTPPPRELPKLVEGARGTLVLFSSRRQMQDVFDGLERRRVLIQGNLSKQER